MDSPVRVLFDTNIYGLIAKENDPERLLEGIGTSKAMICGSKIVRKELRNIPIDKSRDARQLRSDVLKYYRLLVKDKRDYEVNQPIKELAHEYEKAYRRIHKAKDLENDFLIVATASIHQIKIVCSNDERTMKSTSALKIYAEINSKFKLPKPEFLSLEQFKELIK